MRVETQPMTPRFSPLCRSITPQSAGERVSALIADIIMAALIVTENWRKISPEMPVMKASGTNTESRTRVIAMLGAVICSIAFLVDRQSVVSGKCVYVRVDPRGRRIIQKKQTYT